LTELPDTPLTRHIFTKDARFLRSVRVDGSLDVKGAERVAVEERIARQVITPKSEGDAALIVTDITGTQSRTVIKEDGSIQATQVKVGDLIFESNEAKWILREKEDGLYLINSSGVYKIMVEKVA
jgi:hypothetical protein